MVLRSPGPALAVVAVCALLCGCTRKPAAAPSDAPAADGCTLVREGFGPPGTVPVRAETVVSGLEVPWALAFLPGGDLLVTERPGRLRLVRGGRLVEAPVARFDVTAEGEGGLLGLALHPDFAANRLFYVYLTAGSPAANRIERWRLAPDGLSATLDRAILEGIPASPVHDGGRLRFGPDGMLYASTGDAGEPERAPDLESLGGKLLRLTPDGEIPSDNPFAGKAAFVRGIRNSEGFAWKDDLLYVVDHGPSGDLGRRGLDEVNLAAAGDDLGWPRSFGCDAREGLVSPSLSWTDAVPPGGAAVYTGTRIPEWRGSLLVGTLGSRHLHRVAFQAQAPRRVEQHEVYFQGERPQGLGRIREAIMGPDGELYLTTSNCDGRGTCPPDKDLIVRVAR